METDREVGEHDAEHDVAAIRLRGGLGGYARGGATVAAGARRSGSVVGARGWLTITSAGAERR